MDMHDHDKYEHEQPCFVCLVDNVKPRKRKEHEISTSDEGEIMDGSEGGPKKGKLKSGRCAKIDSTDIRRVVRYPHSKLNL